MFPLLVVKLKELSPDTLVGGSTNITSDPTVQPAVPQEQRLHVTDRTSHIRFLVDSGSAVSVIPRTLVRQKTTLSDLTFTQRTRQSFILMESTSLSWTWIFAETLHGRSLSLTCTQLLLGQTFWANSNFSLILRTNAWSTQLLHYQHQHFLHKRNTYQFAQCSVCPNFKNF